MKAEISDRDLGSARGVNITLPERATYRAWFGVDGRTNGIRIEHMSRACVRALGEALIEAARRHAEECDVEIEEP
jgi:hypothetical protein